MVGSLASSINTFASRGRADVIRVPPQALLRPSARPGAELAGLIESQIIPRLMLAQRAETSPARIEGVGARGVDAFTRMALASEAPALSAYVETLMQAGLPLKSVYVDLLIPTARRLGDDWNEDLISFTDVTVGLSRLQQVVRSLGRSLPPRDPAPDARAACFALAPGEQHSFGLMLVEDGFRRAGWRTWLDTGDHAETPADAVSREWFDVLGLSASSDIAEEVLAAAVAELRRASRNPRLLVLAGGRVFAEDTALAVRVGADAVIGDAAQALSLADNAIKPRALA